MHRIFMPVSTHLFSYCVSYSVVLGLQRFPLRHKMLTQTGRGYPKGANLLECKVCLGSESKTVTHLKGTIHSKCLNQIPLSAASMLHFTVIARFPKFSPQTCMQVPRRSCRGNKQLSPNRPDSIFPDSCRELSNEH